GAACTSACSRLVDESTNAQVPQTLIMCDELSVLERIAGPDALHRTRETRRLRKQIRCGVLHAHGNIRRRHLNVPFRWGIAEWRWGCKVPRKCSVAGDAFETEALSLLVH